MTDTQASATQQTLSFLQERSSVSASIGFPFFWRTDYRKICNALVIALLLLSQSVFAETSGVTYTVQRGDCLSGIAKAHYPDATGYYFVLRANPQIVDEDKIAIGDDVFLPGLRNDELLASIDQRGCNAAANRAAGITSQREADPQVARSAVESPSRVTDTRSSVVAKRRVARQVRTMPAPIDRSNRTVAVKPRGEPTRPVRAVVRQPLFAVDEEYTSAPRVAAPPTGVSFAVNAIGAVAPGGQNVLVQEADQNFYIGPAPVPVAGPTQEELLTDLERAIASGSTTGSTGVGNLIIDQALFARERASAGEDE